MGQHTYHKVGDILDGRYEVTKVLQGGMGQIFVCSDTRGESAEQIVLKTFTGDPESPDYPSMRDRFLREAEAWFRIGRTDQSVDWFYLGLNGTTIIDGRPYLIMNYCPGGSLRDKLHAGPLEPSEAIRIATQVLLGMRIIDDQHGLIHRDLKPENILFTKSGTATVSDLGIAKFLEGNTLPGAIPKDLTTLTRHNTFIGTLVYAAPEQLLPNMNTDMGIDIWAFGVVFYEILLGTRPFVGEDADEVVWAIVHSPVPGLDEISRKCGRKLRSILERCLQKSKSDRYASFSELLREWDFLIRLPGSPKRGGWFSKDNRVEIDDPRVEQVWYELFPERRTAEKAEWAINYSAFNRHDEAYDLLRIGRPEAALQSCAIGLETVVNGKNNLERLLAGELTDNTPMVEWKEGSNSAVSKRYMIPSRSVAESTLYAQMCCYVDIIETLRENPEKQADERRAFDVFLPLCDQICNARYPSKRIAIMCAEGYVLAKQWTKAMPLLDGLQRSFPSDAKIATVYFVAALDALKPESVAALAYRLMEAHKEVVDEGSQALCARLSAYLRRPEDAERFSMRALKMNPGNLHLMHLLTGALFNQGKQQQALEIYQEMYRIAPDNPMTKKTGAYFQQR